MPATHEITDIVEKVKTRLEKARQRGIDLDVIEWRCDEDWLYIVIVPSKAGVRASDHANLMSQIERELRDEGIDKVLLVPALSD